MMTAGRGGLKWAKKDDAIKAQLLGGLVRKMMDFFHNAVTEVFMYLLTY